MDARIKNGTPLHGQSLCETCSRAHIARGFGEGEVLVICQATSPEHRVRYRVPVGSTSHSYVGLRDEKRSLR